MLIYRLTRYKYSFELNGYGASMSSSNRWNSKGVEIIYCANSRALAFAEVMPHLSLDLIPLDYMMMTIEIPNSIKPKELPLEKAITSFSKEQTRILGDQFIREAKSLLLKVPSFVVKGDYNILINPHHKDFDKVRVDNVEEFPFDPRYFNQ